MRYFGATSSTRFKNAAISSPLGLGVGGDVDGHAGSDRSLLTAEREFDLAFEQKPRLNLSPAARRSSPCPRAIRPPPLDPTNATSPVRPVARKGIRLPAKSPPPPNRASEALPNPSRHAREPGNRGSATALDQPNALGLPTHSSELRNGLRSLVFEAHLKPVRLAPITANRRVKLGDDDDSVQLLVVRLGNRGLSSVLFELMERLEIHYTVVKFV